jgi:hypothetical protein
MHRVVLPHPFAVEEAMGPVKDDVLADQKHEHLRDKRQGRQRPMTVVIERYQAISGGDVKQQCGADNQHADAQKAGNNRNEEPVAKIGDEIAFLPPGTSGIACPEPRQDRENGCHCDRDRHAPYQGVADIQNEGEWYGYPIKGA